VRLLACREQGVAGLMRRATRIERTRIRSGELEVVGLAA
jgi:hypothetical protein